MSLADLLPAIRALPKAEQVQLLHLLVDGVAETAGPVSSVPAAVSRDDIPDELRNLIPATAQVWFPEANPGALAAALQVLQEGRDGG